MIAEAAISCWTPERRQGFVELRCDVTVFLAGHLLECGPYATGANNWDQTESR